MEEEPRRTGCCLRQGATGLHEGPLVVQAQQNQSRVPAVKSYLITQDSIEARVRTHFLICLTTAWLFVIATIATASESPQKSFPGGERSDSGRLQISAATEKLFLAPPRNQDELRTMQEHMQRLSKKVIPAVVGIRLKNGMGSGVIISADGYILSAGHVTGRSNKPATVFLPDGRKFSATTLGANHRVDAGLLKISDDEIDNDNPLPYVPTGDSDALQYGQWCVAVGHPGGFQEDRKPAVRMGRMLLQGENIIVTDCTLVGGDSGGPLFSAAGEVIGIHSRIGEGIEANLHIPVNVFEKDWGRFAQGDVWGGPSPGGPFLGVLEAGNREEAEIGRVIPGGPAALAGMRGGDIVLKFNGKPIQTFSQLVSAVAECDPGEMVRLDVRRETKQLVIKVEIGTFGFNAYN